MAYAIQGLKVKPTYEQLINVAVSDGLEQIKFPNRDASFLRNGFVLSQLDGEGARIMEKQQEMASKQAFKESLLKDIAINTGSNLHELRNQHEADLRTERVNQALNPNPQFYNISQSDHEMETMHSSSSSEDTEMRDDMAVSSKTTSLPSLDSNAMSVDVANQSTAVADHTGEIERQRQIAENERLQLEIRQSQQLENVRQQAASVLQATTQELTESHRNEAIAYVTNLTENAFKKLNKQSQEIHQMASNDERTRQTITTLKNQLRNQEKEQETPIRAIPKAKATPKAKTEPPFKFNTETMGVKDDENPETTHEPKGKRGRPTNIRRTIEKQNKNQKGNGYEVDDQTPQNKTKKPTHDTEKDMSRSRTHWRQANRGYLVDQLSKHGWKWPKTPDGKNAKLLKPDLYKIMIELLGI